MSASILTKVHSVETKSLLILFTLMVLIAVVPVRVASQALPTGTLWVTYVNATPTTTGSATTLDIVFCVVCFTCDPYLGSVAHPVDGVKSATFLLVSMETQQSHEYPDTPVFPTGTEGEYRANIQIVPQDPTGHVWVYVKGNSLSLSVEGGELVGPPINTASEQTYVTGDMSLIQIGQVSTPSALDKFVQGNGLLLIMLVLVIALMFAVSLLMRRRGKLS